MLGLDRGSSRRSAAAVRRSAKGKQVAARVAAWIVAIRLVPLRTLVKYIFNKGWVSSNP